MRRNRCLDTGSFGTRGDEATIYTLNGYAVYDTD